MAPQRQEYLRAQSRRSAAIKSALSAGLAVILLASAEPVAVAQPPVGRSACDVPPNPGKFQDRTGSATIAVTNVDDACLRTYRLTSSTSGSSEFAELPGRPVLRSGSALLDGLYALAHHEAEQNKADELTDGSYNGGAPVACPGGCYITGKSWTYVWTRDVSYAADLGLTAADPERMRNTLGFKLSDRRDGSGDTQVIQDTGTGGSYPNSTDRVVWAMGASEILDWLPDAERREFAATALDAIRNTVEHDRTAVFDRRDGLYLGEQSFLDWREQSYPDWTKDDVANIATSRSLSTNVTHWAAIDAASRLASGAGDDQAAGKYRRWADELLQTIRTRFWLPDKGQFAQMLTTELDTSPVNRYDALGTSLAVLTGVATPEQAGQAVANYPRTEFGPAVFWPQQQGVEPYHNNGIWPFVTAYLMRAAAQTGNDGVATAQAQSLIRGAALFGTNKENINLLNGGTDTAINSDRQTWSIAGMLSMVQQSLFGIDAREDGLHVEPFVPAQLRSQYFGASESAVLQGLDYRGHKIDVTLKLPGAGAGEGAYTVRSLTLNGNELPPGTAITEDMLGEGTSALTVELGEPKPSVPAPAPVDVSDHEALYGPTTPEVRSVVAEGDSVKVAIGTGGEDPAKVSMDILRDGTVVAENVPVTGAQQEWVDTGAKAGSVSHCYSARLTYTSSGNTSQHARPICYWGPGYDRVLKSTGEQFEAVGGTRAQNENGVYYANWGTAPDDKLTTRMTPTADGEYLVQADAAVGGPINTGVSGGIKMLRVFDDATGELVAEDVLAMPNTGSWSAVRGSTFATAGLKAGRTYRFELLNDRRAVNMSYFTDNALYNETRNGPANYSDVFAIKAMLKQPPAR